MSSLLRESSRQSMPEADPKIHAGGEGSRVGDD